MFRDHKRSVSSASKGRKYETPLPPPRSLPATWRKPRKNVGDRVFVASSSVVYLEFLDENLKRVESVLNNLREYGCAEKTENINSEEQIRKLKDWAIFRNTYRDLEDFEFQEVCLFIGKNCILILA